MVSNSKDDHPSKATPIAIIVPSTHPKTMQRTMVQQVPHSTAAKSFLSSSSVGGEKSKQPMAQGALLDSTYMIIVSTSASILCSTSLQLYHITSLSKYSIG